jgi:molybdate transport system permease protein
LDESIWQLVRVTLVVAGGATALVALPALATGYLLARREFRGKSVAETIVALPLVLPPTAVGFLLLSLFAYDGPLGARALGFDAGVLLTWKGAVLASAVMAFPLVARTARVAFEGVEPRLERMGHSLGLSRSQVLRRITLPLARRGVLAALALGFGRALGEFGATVVVGGNNAGRTETLSLAIFNEIEAGHDARAMQLVGVAALVAFALVFCVERLLRPRSAERAPR